MQTLFTVRQVLEATAGQLPALPALPTLHTLPTLPTGSMDYRNTDKGVENSADAVIIDSRKVVKNSLFVPLVGARVDAHDFIEDVVQKGASIVLVAIKNWPRQEALCRSLMHQYQVNFILVEDTLRALQDLAYYHINRFPDLIRIGVTGSSGKTTTKEIIGHILSYAGEAVINEGNLNSDIGLPLSIFKAGSTHRYAVFEMGMNYPGEMDILARLVRPQFALITNIGQAHLEQLGSKEGIAREKKKVFKYFTGTEKGFIYEKEPFYALLSEGVKGDIIPYGPEHIKGYKGATDLGLEGTTLYWEELQIRFPLVGQHNLLNALGALALTSEMGIDKQAIKKGLETVTPLFGRSQVYRGEISLIQDYYNSNPDSAGAAMEFFHDLHWEGRKILVLGSMLELGAASEQAHQQVGEQVLRFGFKHVFFFGKEMAAAFEVLRSAGSNQNSFWAEDFGAFLTALVKTVQSGDLILIKGSRGMQLERLVEPIKGLLNKL